MAKATIVISDIECGEVDVDYKMEPGVPMRAGGAEIDIEKCTPAQAMTVRLLEFLAKSATDDKATVQIKSVKTSKVQ